MTDRQRYSMYRQDGQAAVDTCACNPVRRPGRRPLRLRAPGCQQARASAGRWRSATGRTRRSAPRRPRSAACRSGRPRRPPRRARPAPPGPPGRGRGPGRPTRLRARPLGRPSSPRWGESWRPLRLPGPAARRPLPARARARRPPPPPARRARGAPGAQGRGARVDERARRAAPRPRFARAAPVRHSARVSASASAGRAALCVTEHCTTRVPAYMQSTSRPGRERRLVRTMPTLHRPRPRRLAAPRPRLLRAQRAAGHSHVLQVSKIPHARLEHYGTLCSQRRHACVL